jgi:hypothetical protein
MARAVHATNDVAWPESDLMLADLCEFLSDMEMDVAPMPKMPLVAANDNVVRSGVVKLEAWPRAVWVAAYRTVE